MSERERLCIETVRRELAYQRLDYVELSAATIVHLVPVGMRAVVLVIGHPDDGSYEWALRDEQERWHCSNSGYGSAASALRDGLIAWEPLDKEELTEFIKRFSDGDPVAPAIQAAYAARKYRLALAAAVEHYDGGDTDTPGNQALIDQYWSELGELSEKAIALHEGSGE